MSRGHEANHSKLEQRGRMSRAQASAQTTKSRRIPTPPTFSTARPFENLEAEERADLSELCQSSTPLATLHTLVQSFGQIVRKREGHRLDVWKQQVSESGIAEVQRFAKGLERDKEAVRAGLTEIYSNGMTEGFVNKLKLIKRQMFGKAGFALLRQRVLHAL